MKTLETVLKRALLVVALIFLWSIAAGNMNPLFVPSPLVVLEDLITTASSGQLWKAFGYSFLRITVATLISGVVAFIFGIGLYNFKLLKDFLYPIISAMRYIPVTAFYPLLILWFGINEEMKIMFLFIATFVYMMPSVMLALEEVSQDLIDTGLTIGMSKVQTILLIQIPATLPSLLNSYIMMYGIGWTYIAVTETINARYGLGWIIQQASSRGKTDMVFMAILVIVVTSVLFDNISKQIVKKSFKWKYLQEDK